MSEDSRKLYGRSVIYSDVDETQIDTNILTELTNAVNKFTKNKNDINYLVKYYKGDQPIKNREKTFNNTINNKITENRAFEIVEFHKGYFLSAPIQFIDDDPQNEITDKLKSLNDFMKTEDIESVDLDIVEDFFTCGVAYKMIYPNSEYDKNLCNSPFLVSRLDPATTFVVYSSKLGHKPLFGVTFVTLEDNTEYYYVYTKDKYFEIKDSKIVVQEPHIMGTVPIIEYYSNKSRIGSFEPVVSLLDAINLTQSNRLDGVEQFIQALLCLEGVDLTTETTDENGNKTEINPFQQLKEQGGLQLPAGSKAYYLAQQLDQSQTQTLIDDMYDTVLEICGMPQRQHTASGGDTGAAILLKDGWSAAEARAKNTESNFKKSERLFLNIAIMITDTIANIEIKPIQVAIRFPRRNYTNDSAKVSNLISMLNSEKISPQLAFSHSDMFPDPNAAYQESKIWMEEQEKKQVDELSNLNKSESSTDGVNADENNNVTSTIV
jgi:SPP1 family phage portal protein